MVEVEGRELHVNAEGTGRPIVVLEAGIAASSLSWCLVSERIAEFATVVSYDRAGLGWSDPAAGGWTALDAAQDLALMLERSDFPAPFVLVGHSFGALIVRLFEQLHPQRVAGMVLVDPVVRSEWREPGEQRSRMLARGVSLSRRGAWLARAGVVGLALKMLTGGSPRIPRLLARAAAGNGAGVTSRLAGEVGKMPCELWPAIAAHWSESRSFVTMANNLEQLPVSAAQIDENRGLRDLPLVVLSAGRDNPEHDRDARLSTRGEHVVIANSGHWMQLDAPEAVVAAVTQVVADARAKC
jgi:pimeloyl-ACP methyl ester carboxylesterase